MRGFRPIQEVDRCIYVKGSTEESNLFIILTHVDDLLLICQNEGELKRFKQKKEAEFQQITYHDEEISFLGMAV